MSRLTDLLARVKAKDAQLGADLEREFKALSGRRAFGLNFERHQPEAVELPNRPVRKGDKVRILPPRGSTAKGDQRLWRVNRLAGETADLACIEGETEESCKAAVADLVVVAEFRDFIYPGLVSTGRVERGGDKPFHTVINAENYHALKALTYTHRGAVDAIYIDPPYNSGASDWKYNNNYVGKDDHYRHSKWLAFLERRLEIAKVLLNPRKSVLIFTIDEREYLRAGMLLEQIMPDGRVIMLSSVINPKGVPREGFSRVDEFIFIVQFGDCQVEKEIKGKTGGKEVRWRGLTRTGANGVRSKSPGAFYPIYFDESGNLASIGDALAKDATPDSITVPAGLTAVWPTPRPDGEDGRWSVVPETLTKLRSQGAVKVGKVDKDKGQYPIFYLTDKQMKAIEQGKLEVEVRIVEAY